MNNYENKNLIQFDIIKIRTKIDYFKRYRVKFNEQYNSKNSLLVYKKIHKKGLIHVMHIRKVSDLQRLLFLYAFCSRTNSYMT